MYISFNISMEFELHGVKLKYEDGNVYRLYHLKKGDEWKKIKYNYRSDGYIQLRFAVDKNIFIVKVHRLVYWLHNPKWDIFNSSRDNAIDHINGIRDDNHIENLRLVTQQQNNWNRTHTKGCSWSKEKQKWCAYIRVNKKLKHLGVFELEEDAHQAYLDAKEIYHII